MKIILNLDINDEEHRFIAGKCIQDLDNTNCVVVYSITDKYKYNCNIYKLKSGTVKISVWRQEEI